MRKGIIFVVVCAFGLFIPASHAWAPGITYTDFDSFLDTGKFSEDHCV